MTLQMQTGQMGLDDREKFHIVYFGKRDTDLFKNVHLANAEVEDKVRFWHVEGNVCDQ